MERLYGIQAVGLGTESRVLILPPLVAREVAALGAYWAWERWVVRGYNPAVIAVADVAAAVLLALVLLNLPPPPGLTRAEPKQPGAASSRKARPPC